MKIIPLLDSKGTVKAWADRQTGWINDLTGNVFCAYQIRRRFFSNRRADWLVWRRLHSGPPRSRGSVHEQENSTPHDATAEEDPATAEFALAVGPSNFAMVAHAAPQKTALGGFCDIL